MIQILLAKSKYLKIYIFKIKMKKSNSIGSPPISADNKIPDLMSSIESKLCLLASDNFDMTGQDILAQSLPNVLYSSPFKQQLKISDLDRTPQSPSPVMTRIDQFQKQYINKLSTLNNKISVLQAENAQLRHSSQELEQALNKEQQKCQILQSEQQSIVERRIEEMKDNLIGRMREQIEGEVEQYINQLREMREELSLERRERKQIEKQAELLKLQRNNFEELYRQIMNKYKVLMQAEIRQHQNQHQQQNRNPFVNVYGEYKKEDNLVKSKVNSEGKGEKNKTDLVNKKRKSSKKHKIKASDLSKQDLIPFLTRGIEELKEKLNLQ